MQRDAYAALIKFPNRRKIPVRIMQMNGKVVCENLMQDVFRGYRVRRLALMTYTTGQDPRLPRLPQDVIISSFEALAKLHQPHFVYQLVPVLSTDIDTFMVLQAVCAAPGSPFSLRDRLDSQILNYRFNLLAHSRERICEFFKDETSPTELLMPPSTRRLPISQVTFHGILFREKIPLTLEAGTRRLLGSAAAPPTARTMRTPSGGVFVTTHDVCTDAAIKSRALMTRFARSSLFTDMLGSSPLTSLVLAADVQWHIMAMRRPIGGTGSAQETRRLRTRLLAAAHKEGLLLYEKGPDEIFRYAT